MPGAGREGRMEELYLSEAVLADPPEADSWLAGVPAVKYLLAHGSLSFHRRVTFLVGENGVGKSTLLEAVAVAAGFPAEGGSRNFSGTGRPDGSDLAGRLRLVRRGYPEDGFFLRAESFYDAAGYIDDHDEDHLLRNSYGGRSLLEQSHGESFLSLVQNRFRGHGLYLLDEPEAALSPLRQLTLMAEISRLAATSQLIIATHSPMLIALPGACVYEMSGAEIQERSYRDTAHYQLARAFLDSPERILRQLLDEDQEK